ncbi:hypothetical protein AMS68_007081 [Peltaster fructicola]|uniref:Peroxisomal biogenesis factor 11 n=1 Tax=Peltaster fructicola TaxID=286661 RepID=A0A6H0Y3H3_9PEZI|nr:hypothetical protein AMS68_007081 [Peltaster fructicola]
MVADAIVYHPAMAHYSRFVATTVGRDKALRTLQYLSRFLAWYTYRTNESQSTVDFFEKTKKNFGVVRKAMRLGKFVEHFKAAAVAYDSKQPDPVLKFLAITRQIGYGFYLLLDNICYIDSAGIKKFESAAKLSKNAARAWWVGIASNVVAGFYTLYSLQQAMNRQQHSADAEKAVEAKKLAKDYASARLQLFSDLCDLTLPSTTLGYTKFDDGVLGLAGTTSSLIGLYGAWKKTA